MVDDKWIGLALAMSSSLAIGTSFIITKKVRSVGLGSCSRSFNVVQGLNDAARSDSGYVQASEDRAYLRNPIWWAGMSTSKSLSVRLASLEFCYIFILKCAVVLGEGECAAIGFLDRVLDMLFPSGKFRSVHFCASNTGDTLRCP